MIPTSHYLFLSLGLFTIGVIGVVTRRNVIIILMSIELMLNAVNINFVAINYFRPEGEGTHVVLTGQLFAVFVTTVAAAEAAVGLAIILALYRNLRTINVDTASRLSG